MSQDITSGSVSSASASIERMFMVLKMPAANTDDDVRERSKFLGLFKMTLGAAAAHIKPSQQQQQQQAEAALQNLTADIEKVLDDQGLQVQRHELGALWHGEPPLARQPAPRYASSVAKLAADVRVSQPTAAAAGTASSLAAFQQLVSSTHTLVLQKKALLASADLYQMGQQEALKRRMDSFAEQAAAVCAKAYQSVLDSLPNGSTLARVSYLRAVPCQALP